MQEITINDIVMQIVRKKIKNLRLTVYAPEGQVRISVPFKTKDEVVRHFVNSRIDWIEKHRARFMARPVQPVPEYISGESHYYEGRPYLLNVVYWEGLGQVKLSDEEGVMTLQVRPGSSIAERARVMMAWYREQIKKQMIALIPKWEAVVGVKAADYRIKQMKTRWGTCNIQARRIWLNLELAKRPVNCLEYVIVHEMVHLLERYHNDRFRAFMDQFMPPWRDYKDALSRPL